MSLRGIVTAVLVSFLAFAAFAQDQSPRLDRGFAADKVYQYGDLDQIDLFNGSLKVTLPIGPRYPVNGELNYGFTLVYNSQIWDLDPGTWRGFDEDANHNVYYVEFPYVDAAPTGHSNAGMGWMLSLGKLFQDGGPYNDGGQWLYEGPDGADHEVGQLEHVGDVGYSRDSTYLRAKRTAETEVTLEFPDGTIHTFERYNKRNWRLRKIEDRFGNAVTVTYQGDDVWTVRDDHGREQKVYFTEAKTYGWTGTAYNRRMVDRVVLTSFDDHPPLEYKFIYEQANIKNTCDSSFQLHTPKDYKNQPFLKQLRLPDGSTFDFTYANSKGSPANPAQCEQGALTKMELPTGGAIGWTYKRYLLPAWDCDKGFYALGVAPPGVATRTMYDENNLAGERITSYSQTFAPRTDVDAICNGSANVSEWVGTVIDQPDQTRTIHYFTLWPIVKNTTGYSIREHAVPYRRMPDGRRLSTEFYGKCTAADCLPLRSTYVRWEFESSDEPAERFMSFNRRQTYEETVFHDDGDKYIRKSFGEFDGVGHFRAASHESTLPSSPYRSEYVNWDATTGERIVNYEGEIQRDATFPDKNSPWVLNTYARRTTSENGTYENSEYCFDKTTGFITRKRMFAGEGAGTNDVLVVYSHETGDSSQDGRGNVLSEEYYGGDVQKLDAAQLVCDTPLPEEGPQLTILHRYQYGVRNSSQYKDAPFKLFDQTIDKQAGLPASEKDISGITTTYDYDSMLRLQWEKPEPGHGPWHKYLVTNATSSSRASADIVSYRNGSESDELTHQRVLYDAFGRVWRELTRLPELNEEGEEQWSIRETLYDKMGRKDSESSVVLYDGSSPSEKTSYTYDPFGRVQSVLAPDNSYTQYNYVGASTIVRTRAAATEAAGQSPVQVTETYDAAARLVGVQEASAGTSTDAPKGGATATTYGYDVAGRLTAVKVGTQERSFQYDGRGFLLRETHPENGETRYEDYDARGHAGKRISGGRTVQSTFDEFERLRTMKELPSGTLIKEFDFGDSNDGNNRKQGKVTKAVRRNELTSAGTVDVTESYEYREKGGQLSLRTTDVERVTKNADGTETRTPIQKFQYGLNYDDNVLPRTLTMPTCLLPGCSASGGLTSVTNARKDGKLTAVQGFGAITYHPNGMVHTVKHETPLQPIDTYDVRFGIPRPSKIKFDACGDDQPYFLPGSVVVKANTLPGSCGLQVSWPAAVTCGGTSNIKYTLYKNGAPIASCLTERTYLDRDVKQNDKNVYRIIAEGPRTDGGTGTCNQGGKLSLPIESKQFLFNSCNPETNLVAEGRTASIGVPVLFTARLSGANGPVAGEELILSINDKLIAKRVTGPNGEVVIQHALDVDPGDYEFRAEYAGGIMPSAVATATIHATCDFASYSVFPISFNVLPAGGTFDVIVQTSKHCEWNPVPDKIKPDPAAFLGVKIVQPPPTTPPVNPKGNGKFDLTVDSADGSVNRTGFVAVGYRQLRVEQGSNCTYRFEPGISYVQAFSFSPVFVDISAPADCEWEIDVDKSWVHLGGQARGRGAGSFTFTVDHNTGTGAPRRGATFTITKNGQPVLGPNGKPYEGYVNQYAPPPVECPVLVEDLKGGTVTNGQNISMRAYIKGTYLKYTWFVNDRKAFECEDDSCSNITIGPGQDHYPGPGETAKFVLHASNNHVGSDCESVTTSTVTWRNASQPGECHVPTLSNSTFGTNAWPGDATAGFPGSRVTLSVRASNYPYPQEEVTYQWYQGFAPDDKEQNKIPSVDGLPDTAEVRASGISFYWVKVSNHCGSQISRTAMVTVVGPPKRPAVGHNDVNGDRKADIVWHNSNSGANEYWLSSGDAYYTAQLPPNSNTDAQLQSIGDLTGDQAPDFLWRDPKTGKNELWPMHGTVRAAQPIPLETRPGASWVIGGVGDFDEDENHDIVWHDNATGKNEIWFQNGTSHEGTWALPSNGNGQWGLHGAADFNFDGRPDLYFYDRTTGSSSIWVMRDEEPVVVSLASGGEAAKSVKRRVRPDVTSLSTKQTNPNLVPVLVADMDGDRFPDILWRNVVDGTNTVWKMLGTIVAETVTITPREDLTWNPGGGGSTNAGTPGSGGPTTGEATSLSLTAPAAQPGSAVPVTATLTAASGPISGRTIVFLLDGAETARLITGADGTAAAAMSVAGLPSGTHTNAITARFDGDAVFASSSATANLVISSAIATVNWSNPASIPYGTPLSTAQLNATASMAGTFTYEPAAGTILDAGYRTLGVTFTPADPAVAPVADQVVIIVTKAPSTVTWQQPEPIAYGVPLTDDQLNAKSALAGTFEYEPSAGTTLAVGATQTLRVTFTPDNANFDRSTATTTIDVGKGIQLVRWSAPPPITVLQPLTAAQLNATVVTSGAAPAGAVTYDPPAGTLLSAGIHELHVNVAATDSYEAATSSVDITVTRVKPVVQWATPAAIVYGTPLSATQLNAAADVAGTFTYEPAAGTILNGGSARLFATFTPADSRYDAVTASVTLQITKTDPLLTWNAPAPIVYGTALTPVQLNASAGTDGDFTYSPPVGTILNAGTHELTVFYVPHAAANYKAASAKVALTVLRAPQTLSWSNPAAIVYGTVLSAAQLNAKVTIHGPSPAGALTYTPPAGTLLQAGNAQTLTVTAAATPNYEQASKSVSIDVLKAKPVLTWATPAPIVYRTMLSAAQLDATSSVPGTFAYTPPAGTLLEAGPQPLAAHFTPADANNYEHGDVTVMLEVQQATPILTWPAPVGIVYGTPLSATQLNATTDVPGAFTYSPAAGTILDAGTGQTLSVQFTPSDTRNFKNASGSVKFDVAKAKQTLSWTPANIVYGTPLGAGQLNAAVSVIGPAPAGTLVYVPPAGTVLDAGTHTLTVTAQEMPNYESATLSVPLEVARKPLSLVVDAKTKLYGGVVPVLTGTLTGVVNNDPITPSYTTTATISSPAGTYPITGTVIDPNSRLFNYSVTITPAALTVLPAPLQISADPKSKQYSDPVPQLTATFTGLVLGETPSVLSGTLVLETTAVRLSTPGTYPIALGGLSSPNYAIVYVPSTLTVTPEDARIEITSPLVVSAPANKPVSVTLAATIKDISATADANGDSDGGDIRKATLAFIDRATNTVLCTAPIGLVASPEERVGVATCTFTRNFGATLPASLVVGARAGGYYTRDVASEDATLSFVAPTADGITSGVWLSIATAAGTYAPDPASEAQLIGNLQYDRGDVVKGELSFTFTRNARKYEISVAVTSLAIVRAVEGGKAAIVGTGRLLDGKTLIATGPVIITATDAGDAKNDSAGIALLNADGGFWFAAGWNGSRVVEQLMRNGNIVVHQGK